MEYQYGISLLMRGRGGYESARKRLRNRDFWELEHAVTAYNLRRLREGKKLTTEQLADLYGSNEKSYFIALESGKRGLGPKTRKKLAAIFGVDESEFLRDPRREQGVAPSKAEQDSELLLEFLDKMTMLLALMRKDPRASLLPLLDGLIALYGRKMPDEKEVQEIIRKTARMKY